MRVVPFLPGPDSRSGVSRLLVCLALTGCGDAPAIAPPETPPVVVALVLSPSTIELEVGDTAVLDAEPRAADGTRLVAPIDWISTNPSIAGVSNSGLLTADGIGNATIIARSQGVSDSAAVTVRARTVAAVEVVPSSLELAIGEAAVLAAYPRAPDGSPLEIPVVWSSSDTTVAVVDASGEVIGISHGNAVIAAEAGGSAGTATVEVTPYPKVDVMLSPGQAFKSVVDSYGPGTVFGFEPGIYNRFGVVPKDSMAFIGGPDVVLDGMNETPFAFRGEAAGLHLIQLEITRYTGLDNDLAAIHGWDGEGWILEDLDVHHNHTSGASVRHGGTILGGWYHHNGKTGINVTQSRDVLVRDVEISHNNLDGRFDPLWDAGGIKVTLSLRVTVEGSFVHDNNGPGIWYDIECDDGRILDNTVRGNTQAGVFYEVSFDGLIEGNHIEGNGAATSLYHGAGVLVSSSSNVTVARNTIIGNAEGIIGLQADRGSRRVSGLQVRDNDIDMQRGGSGLVDVTVAGAPDLVTGRGNLFDENRYEIHQIAEPFFAGRRTVTIAEWQALGHDRSSVIVSF